LTRARELGLGTTLRLSQRVARGLAVHDAFKSAAAVAFWLFLSLVPLFVFLGFLVGQVARRRGVDALLGPVLDVIPAASEGLVRDEIRRLAGRSAAPLAPVSVASYLWTASSGLHNLMDLFEAMVRAARRAYWKQRVLALAWVVAGLLAACVLALSLVRFDSAFRVRDRGSLHPTAPASPSAWAPGSTPSARGESGHALPRGRSSPLATGPEPPKASPPTGLATPLGQAFAASAMLLVGSLFLAGFYRFAVARPRRVRRRVWPGTIAAVACWLLVSWGFGAYAASMGDYALFYGSLAAVAVLLVWLYLTSLSLIVGAEVNALLEESGTEALSKGRRAISPV
jgi:membrane protein